MAFPLFGGALYSHRFAFVVFQESLKNVSSEQLRKEFGVCNTGVRISLALCSWEFIVSIVFVRQKRRKAKGIKCETITFSSLSISVVPTVYLGTPPSDTYAM